MGGGRADISEKDASNSPIVNLPTGKPLSEGDFPTDGFIEIAQYNISQFPSYIDNDGKKHYVLGSGKFKLYSDVNDVVLDVNGQTYLTGFTTNVSVECDSGTSLSIKNLDLNPFGNIGDIGAAIKFKGSNNTLNCYGYNRVFGSKDKYVSYTDTDNGKTYHPACAAINVGNGAELVINGTDSSILDVYGFLDSYGGETALYNGKQYGITAPAIGSNFHEDGGKIVINSGNIQANGVYSGGYVSAGGIGGGENVKIEINGGKIESYDGEYFGIGGGFTVGKSSTGYAEITINGGEVSSTSYGNLNKGLERSAIGFVGNGVINICGGKINVDSWVQGAGIGSSAYSDGGIINITGGEIEVTSSITADPIGSGFQAQPVQVYIDHMLTKVVGTAIGNGLQMYKYSGLGDDMLDNNNSYNEIRESKDIWIQSGTLPFQGIRIQMVDATATAIGIQNLDVMSYEKAQITIQQAHKAIDIVSGYRSAFGAQQNRLEHAKVVDDETCENIQAAESRIRDTDMATELVEFSRHNILEQVRQSLLAQANQSTQGILSFLK